LSYFLKIFIYKYTTFLWRKKKMTVKERKEIGKILHFISLEAK